MERTEKNLGVLAVKDILGQGDMARVFVSIGSNIEREHHVRAAVRALRARFGALALSHVYETEAEGFEGDNFLNLVASFDTQEAPERVQAALHDIETAQGRARNGPRFGPRTLDLDLLLYGDLIRHGDGLDLPRGEIMRYAFVLGPLAELAPRARHPEIGRTYGELWAGFGARRRELTPVALDLDD
jgi:2-amino-4-hydroxy-6-hydroxymethyldihydropteridine diphosphokinase